MLQQFPRTQVEGLSLSRMIIGSNWMAGWSHRSPAADEMIKDMHSETKTIVPMLEAFLSCGIDTIMAPIAQLPVIAGAIEETKQKTGKDIIIVDTPIINVEDSTAGRKEAGDIIRKGRKLGAKLSLIHHSCAEQLVNKGKQKIERLGDYTAMIRDAGMIPGLSAHMPELIVYSDQNEYDVQTYIQIYNCLGFMMQVEIETVNQIIHTAKKPVMTIKPMAAGRCTPFVGLNFSWATLRDCDMVTVGCFNEREAEEDIEISLAALERRPVNIARRSSPNRQQAAFGNEMETTE